MEVGGKNGVQVRVAQGVGKRRKKEELIPTNLNSQCVLGLSMSQAILYPWPSLSAFLQSSEFPDYPMPPHPIL